jgi:acyl-lipid omega-6 desaturase (Delta-12 desaturase)
MKSIGTAETSSVKSHWQRVLARYQGADVRQSVWQIATSFVPYLALCYLMYHSLAFSYWITLGLAVLASGFHLRTFIIFHDCTHGSFFTSQKANDALGIIAGLLSFTPYYEWRHRHALHHATVGNLDRRGWWDIDMLTVREYLDLPTWARWRYRLYRNPLIMFGLGATLFFLVLQRIPRRDARKRERASVYWTNLALLAMIVGLSTLIGFKAYLLVQLPIVVISSTIGLWVFYVQHQFEDGYWAHNPEWDFVTAALKGSSYYKLPRLLQWFTGNIGFHHIHHLSAKIPNYRLEACYEENALFQEVNTITLWTSLQAISAKLWDEDQRRMVGFREVIPLQSRLQPGHDEPGG